MNLQQIQNGSDEKLKSQLNSVIKSFWSEYMTIQETLKNFDKVMSQTNKN